MEDPDAASPRPEILDPDPTSLEAAGILDPDPDPTALQAAMEVPITSSLGPMGPLLRKLHSLRPEQQYLPPNEVRLLTGLCISLKNMSEDDDASFMVQWWMEIVRELCYDTEDEICAGGSPGHGFLSRLQDATEKRKRFLWSPNPKTSKPGCGEAGLMSHSGKIALVQPPEKLVQLMALDDDKILKVIPIYGCAGVGKTTVARILYHKHAGKYQCQAFLNVSRNPDMRGFLTSMISQLKAPQPDGFPDVPDLIHAVSNHLKGKRYFIVIDDLWTASVWDIISYAFPRDGCCSRIITTTQIDDVALACCGYDSENYIYKMKPLNDDESRKLFFGRVFGSEYNCPEEIRELSNDIISKCGGLPLPIVCIASLLASQSNTARGTLKHIKDSLSSTSEGMQDELTIIYNSFAPRLRTCLLYLSIYPHGYVIEKDELVKTWMAEAFLIDVEGRQMKEIAEVYFDELVSRGIVQVVDTNYNGEVLSCTVHQIVLNFIRNKSTEENFVITMDYSQSTLALRDKVRRLAIQFGGVKSASMPKNIKTPQLRSLIFWGFFRCVPSVMECRLLRVLILNIWADVGNTSFDLTRIRELIQLKYIKIKCNITVELPGKIQGLQCLETLEIHAKVASVPLDIIHMRMLYLSLTSESGLPSGIRRMASLRSLGYFDLSSNPADNVIDLGDLPNLEDLHLTCATLCTDNLENNMKWLGLVLGNLSNLKCLTLTPAVSSYVNKLIDTGASSMGICFDGFRIISTPPALQILQLSRHCCIFSSLPEWIGDLVNLSIIKIAVVLLSQKDIDVLKGLPSLIALTLYIQTTPAETIFVEKKGFEVLTYFKFMCPSPCLFFSKGAMPKVQRLNLGFNSEKMKKYSLRVSGFHHLTSLKDICVKFGVRDAQEFDGEAAEKALWDAVGNHPNTPIIRVKCVDVIFDGEEDKSAGYFDSSSKSTYALLSVEKLLKYEWGLDKTVKDGLTIIESELRNVQAFLQNVLDGMPPDQDDSLVKLWFSEVREQSNAIEKRLQFFMAQIESTKGTLLCLELTSYIKETVINVKKVRERYGSYPTKSDSLESTSVRTVDPRIFAMHSKASRLVGIAGAVDDLTRMLSMDDHVSIVGMGGLGKTTLARVVYGKMKGDLDVCAFVSIGRSARVENVLKDILCELDIEIYGGAQNRRQLMEQIHNFLVDKRCFIVIDDLWDIETWKFIKCAFAGSAECKIITTTRKLEVAEKVGGVYMIKPLSPANSTELLHTKIFGSQVKTDDSKFASVVNKILSKCGGVPIAIITIASLLCTKPRDEWSKVYDSIGFGEHEKEDVVEDVRMILSFSYYDLPYHLQRCFLYLTLFPEGHWIEKNMLIWRWIAEGLVPDSAGKTKGLFELGETYFNKLIDRSMIQWAVSHRDLGQGGCRIHGMMLDIIRDHHLSGEMENFCTVIDREQSSTSQSLPIQRLAIHEKGLEEIQNTSLELREVKSLYASTCGGSILPPLSRFRRLRVIDLECCDLSVRDCNLEHIGQLNKLRYVGLSGTPVAKLPKEIRNLWLLQTLDVTGTGMKELPRFVGELRELRCLRAGKGTRMMGYLGKLRSLEELWLHSADKSPYFTRGLSELTELRVLVIHFDEVDEIIQEELVWSLRQLEKLQILQVWSPAEDKVRLESWEYSERYSEPSPKLRQLLLFGVILPRLMPWIHPSSVSELSKLLLEVEVLNAEDLVILGLMPSLHHLHLHSEEYSRLSYTASKEEFKVLEYITTNIELVCGDGALAMIQELEISGIRAGTDVGLRGNMPLLQRATYHLDCKDCDPTKVYMAEIELRRASQDHPNHPAMSIKTFNHPENVDKALPMIQELEISGIRAGTDVGLRGNMPLLQTATYHLDCKDCDPTKVYMAEIELRQASQDHPNHPAMSIKTFNHPENVDKALARKGT